MRGTSNSNVRGNSTTRRARRTWLISTFGDGTHALCAFGCGTLLTVDTVTADRYPVPGCQGGTCRRGNIRPVCMPCNRKHGGGLRSS